MRTWKAFCHVSSSNIHSAFAQTISIINTINRTARICQSSLGRKVHGLQNFTLALKCAKCSTKERCHSLLFVSTRLDCTQKTVASLWRSALVWCLIVYTLSGCSYYLQSTQQRIRGYWPESKRWKHFALAKQGSSSQKTCMHLLCSANATRFFAFHLILWQTHDYNLFRAVSQLSTDLVEVEQQTLPVWKLTGKCCAL